MDNNLNKPNHTSVPGKTPARSRKKNNNIIFLIPLVLLIIIVPLFMRLHVYNPNMGQFAWFSSSGKEYDIFLYYKGIILTAIAVLMVFMLLIRLIIRRFPSLKKDYWLIFLFGYGILTALSTAFSDYRYYGLHGMFDQFETVWVILSYCIVTFYTYVTIRTRKDIDIVKASLFVLLAIMCLIGMSQFVGKDFFASTLGKEIIIPEEHAELRDILDFKFSSSGTHQVYLTLYNPNYVGVFTGLILPITILLIPASKKIVSRLLWIIISVFLLICAFGSGSKAFLISIIAIALAAILFCRKFFIKYYIPVLITVCVFVVTIRGAFAYIGTNPIEYVKAALKITETDYALDSIDFDESDMIVTYNDTILKVRYLNIFGRFIYEFRNEDDDILNATKSGSYTYVLEDEIYNGLSFTYYAGFDDYDFIASMKYAGQEIYFTIIEDEGPLYLTSALKPDTMLQSESAVFTKYEKLASGRGFLWSKTIPLLKDSIILGSGADTFPIMFPHSDYIARINAGYYDQIITKPHSMYLQIGVQHGVLALICYLITCIWYLVQSWRIYWKLNFSDKNQLFGVGIMLGIIGYLILGISNDSTVTIAPIFWMILGLGFAVNRINKIAINKRKESR